MKQTFRKTGCTSVLIGLLAGLLIGVIVTPLSADTEWHGDLKTYYNPQRVRVYRTDKQDFDTMILNPYLMNWARSQSNPFTRYYSEKAVLDHIKETQGEDKVVHNLYQRVNVNLLNLGGENGSLVLQSRMNSADDERQPEIGILQLYYGRKKITKNLTDLKIGRVLSTHAAGLANYDGGSIQLDFGGFYITGYGGILIDDDYIYKEERGCTWPAGFACSFGTQFPDEDQDSKWAARDIRNVSSRERKGDTIGAVAAGYKSKLFTFEVDYQKLTDAKQVTEELGGVNLTAQPIKPLDIYIKSQANLLKGEQRSALAGIAYLAGSWRVNPEYEYYKPQFKEGSLWEQFHTFGRSAGRLNVFKYVGRSLKIGLSGGVLYYLDDNTESESLTTKKTVDPVTGEVIGSHEKAPITVPLYPTDILGNPYTVDPSTGLPQSVPSRPLTFEETVAHAILYSPDRPKNGSEGNLSIDYFVGMLRLQALGSTVQGPEGHVNKAMLNGGWRMGSLYIRVGGGQAYFKDIDSKDGNEHASFGDVLCTYFLGKTTKVEVGAEYYSDATYSRDIRGKFGFSYVF